MPRHVRTLSVIASPVTVLSKLTHLAGTLHVAVIAIRKDLVCT